MNSARTNLPQPPQPGDSRPPTISVYPSQRLEQLPVAALLPFVPRLRTAYRAPARKKKEQVATSRTHYRLKLATGVTLSVSDNLLDLIRLIDGRRSVQALSDALAEQQGRPVHPAEVVYLLRHRLAPAGLVELSFPPALPEPKQTRPLAPATLRATNPQNPTPAASAAATKALVPAGQPDAAQQVASDAVEWIPPGRRAERLRATRRRSPLARQTRKASYISLVATFLVVLAAGTAFAFGNASFTKAGITIPSLSAFFGGPTPTDAARSRFTPTPTPPPHPIYYVVQDGDTLDKIAAHFHVTANALLIVNNLNSPAAIQTEQVLLIPTVYHRGSKIALLAHPIFYVVQQGDTIYDIAQFFGTTADVLLHYNRIPANKANLIHPGDGLVIP